MADKKGRRRSLRIFNPRASTPGSPAPPETSSPVEIRSAIDVTSSMTGDAASPKFRPRVLSKNTLSRNSVFGSFRSLHSLDEDEKGLIKFDSKSSSLQDGDTPSPGTGMFGDHVKKAADVQVTGSSIFKKKTSYVVLTESHLIRFKSQTKASEMFPIIPHGGKNSLPRNTMNPMGTYSDMQANAWQDITQGVPLDEVVSVHRVEDGRPYFTIEVCYLDEQGKRASTIQMILNSYMDADNWTAAIREHAALKRAQRPHIYNQRTLEYLARALDKQKDYDPLQFRVFKVTQRLPVRPAGRAQSDDLSKASSSVCYLVIGINKVHLIPIPRISGRSSSTSLAESDTPTSFGVTSLTSIKLHGADDAFELYFRTPMRQPYIASLASYDAQQIALWLRYVSEYLRPEWTVQSFTFDVPDGLEDQMDPPIAPVEDNNSFDRTLVAFCSAFDVDASRIYYSVDHECEDAPCFRLLPQSDASPYSNMELLAVFRALRYNECFTSISFANLNLCPLRSIYDTYGDSDDSLCNRSGNILDVPGHADLSVLQQEIRALALKSRKLRRFDFSNSMPGANDGKISCGIPEALTPLCKKMLTNVDWVTLNGIRLSDHDIDFLVDAASERQCHLRALEIGECGLSVHDGDVLLSTLGVHDNTMEVLNIAGTQGRFSPELFQRAIGAFSRIRQLNLTRVQKTAGPEPLIAPEILLGWRLESLHLNGTNLNEQSVDTISTYLASPKSDLLRELSVNQCGLTGKDLAIFFQSMTRQAGTARKMRVNASENRIGSGSSILCKRIADNCTPETLVMRMIDFDKEYQFRELVAALAHNTTIRHLDISQASLPYDASMETCEALKEMFSENNTMVELDLGGDIAHIDVARFGIGLNIALTGLENNRVMKVLKIEHQNLGLRGASTLAGVIEANKCLTEIHSEHNDINLQSFTVLINALRKNNTLLYLSAHAADRAKSMEKVKEEFEALDQAQEPQSPQVGMLKKSFHSVTHIGPRHRRQSSTISNQSASSFTQQEVKDTMHTLEQRWDAEISRMQQYLIRNYQTATGFTWEELASGSAAETRPATADSLAKMLAQVNFEKPMHTNSLSLTTSGLGTDAQQTASPMSFQQSALSEKKAMIFTLPED